MSIVGKIEIRKGAKGAKANGGAKWTLPEVTEDMKIKYAEAVKQNTPRNGATKREYTGENVYRLIAAQLAKGYTDSRWYTFNQLQEIGARIKKGEHGTKIMGWWSNAGDDAEAMAAGLTEEEIKATRKMKPKIFVLFNAEQCTGISAAPEAVATVAEAKETKYENVIRGSFEIKPKAKKAEKKETKQAEAAKAPEAVTAEKKAAPIATGKTAERLELIREAIKANKRTQKAAAAWAGKVCNIKFWNAMKEAAEKGLSKGFSAYSGINSWGNANINIYKAGAPRLEAWIFYSYEIKNFTTKEEGKQPRIDSEKFISILKKKEEELTKELNTIKATVQNTDEIKAAMEKMKELSKFLQGFDRDSLITQEMTDKYKVDAYLRF